MEWNRYLEYESLEQFLEANTGLSLNDLTDLKPVRPTEILGLQEAAQLISQYVQAKKAIRIFGDYDCDGIMASFILYYLILKLGHHADVQLPKRLSHGYGLHQSVIDEMKGDSLLITVDNGITAVKEIESAKNKGIQVIVIDHHLPDSTLPPADVIVNPVLQANARKYPYCGAGLALKLAERMTIDNRLLKTMTVYAAIATVADMVPLTHDNRRIVKYGLEQLRNPFYLPLGVRMLLQWLHLKEVDEEDIKFSIGPVINAAGRIYDQGAKYVFDTLTCKSKSDMKERLNKLIEWNEIRKQMVQEAYEKIVIEPSTRQGIIIVYQPGIQEGILGLIASQIVRDFNVPAIVFTDARENGFLKGSGRSVKGVHLKQLLDDSAHFLVKYGGHAPAAGLTLAINHLQPFKEHMEKLMATQVYCVNDYDLILEPQNIATELCKLQNYRPYGAGNPTPNYLIENIICIPRKTSHYRKFGRQKNHLELYANGYTLIAFGKAEEYISNGAYQKLDVIGSLCYDKAGQPQIKVSKIHPSRMIPSKLQVQLSEIRTI